MRNNYVNSFLINALLLASYFSLVCASKNITLSCSKYAGDILCRVPMNISASMPVEVVKVEGQSLSQKQLDSAKAVVISYQNIFIERLPQNISTHFVDLEKLIANLIGLRTVSRDDFTGMNKLKVLNLSNNKIKSVYYAAFHDLESLEVLYLSGNLITNLHVAMLAKSVEIKTFFADHNMITRLEDMFLNNPKIESIYINNNVLKTVEPNFEKLEKLRNLDLRRNSNICVNCSLSNKASRVRLINLCDEYSNTQTKAYQENFQNCVIVSLKNDSKIEGDFVNCTAILETKPAIIAKDYKECLANKTNKNQCKTNQLTDEQDMRNDFDTCVVDLISSDIEAKNLLLNCSTIKDNQRLKVTEHYSECNLCPIEIEPNIIRKCELKFSAASGKPIAEFQKEVAEFFSEPIS